MQVKAEAEKKKLRAGRMLLAGLSLGEEESEQLEGMSPQVGSSRRGLTCGSHCVVSLHKGSSLRSRLTIV